MSSSRIRVTALGAVTIAVDGRHAGPSGPGAASASPWGRGWGASQILPLPSWMRSAFAILLMDYTLYLWHVLTHRVPWLWRLHMVHHVDMDPQSPRLVR